MTASQQLPLRESSDSVLGLALCTAELCSALAERSLLGP